MVHSLYQLLMRLPIHIWLADEMKFDSLKENLGEVKAIKTILFFALSLSLSLSLWTESLHYCNMAY